ncbi:unnamed protein product [Nezara viridula]|uniref:Neuropeptide n=1 Tax=Nezara viridula TaxID=85310 RepID=A0A9P0H9A5_NEZVI|nr:unnamed protein product [Nezara viridula]
MKHHIWKAVITGFICLSFSLHDHVAARNVDTSMITRMMATTYATPSEYAITDQKNNNPELAIGPSLSDDNKPSNCCQNAGWISEDEKLFVEEVGWIAVSGAERDFGGKHS